MKRVIGYIRDRDGVAEVRRVFGEAGDIDGVECIPITDARKLRRIEHEMDDRILKESRARKAT